MAETIYLSLFGSLVGNTPGGIDGDMRFRAFRKAIEGSIYDRANKRSLATLDKIPGILTRLREGEFAISMEGAVCRALSEQEAQLWADVQGAKDRAKRFDAEMRKRGSHLYPFQFSGIEWLARKHGALLADQMGLGKTLQAIASFPANAAVLVVAPAVAKGVWRTELRRWRPNLKVVVLKGRDSFRWPEKGEVVVTNYDILPEAHTKTCNELRKSKDLIPGEHSDDCKKAQSNMFIPAVATLARQCKGCKKKSDVAKQCPGCLPFLKATPDEIVIVADEAHAIKNGVAQRTIKFRALAKNVRDRRGRVWLLTATPLLNNPNDLWSILKSAVVAEEAFGSFKDFTRILGGTAKEHGGFEWSGDPDSVEVLERMQRVMLRRLREDVMPELPRKQWTDIVVDVDAKALKACDALLRQYGSGFESAISDAIAKGTAKFEALSQVRAALAKAKIPSMMEVVEEHEEMDEPLVVFSVHRAPIDLLGKREGWRTITGDTPTDERSEVENLFQSCAECAKRVHEHEEVSGKRLCADGKRFRSSLRGVAATVQAGGVAITLTAACRALFVDRPWTPALEEQAEDRICRITQWRPCTILRLVADHAVDERVNELLSQKRKLIDSTIDAEKNESATAASTPNHEDTSHATQDSQ